MRGYYETKKNPGKPLVKKPAAKKAVAKVKAALEPVSVNSRNTMVGDKVKCVNEGPYSPSKLKVGKVYTVRAIDSVYVRVKEGRVEVEGGWYHHRFVKEK